MVQTQAGWSPGSRVGDYELLRRLGSGGMGEVHAARHQATGATVALKTLSYQDAELLLRFQREAEAQARVDAHPHVARIHASGVHHGRPYLVMDLITGGDLQQRLDQAPLSPTEAAALLAQLAGAIDHCHARQVLHRDLKPANVLFDEQGRPLLVDFGLASLGDATSLTQTGTLLGTPAYMAPEQASGQRARIGPPTDVYGLGALLYACLTGVPPHTAPGQLELLRQVLEEPPVRPSARRPEIPPALEAICLEAMAKDPAARPTAADLVERLRAFLASPAEPRPRRPAIWLVTAVVGVGLALGLRARSSGDAPPGPAPPSTTWEPSASPSPSPSPTLSSAQRRLLDDPEGSFDPDAPPLDVAAALILAAPPPPLGGDQEPALLEVAQSWLAAPDALPGAHRRELLAAAQIYRGYHEGLLHEDPQPLLALERALLHAQRADWEALEREGADAIRQALNALPRDHPLTWAMRARAQRALYGLYRQWWLARGPAVPGRAEQLTQAVELCPAAPTATHLGVLAAIHDAFVAHGGFEFGFVPPARASPLVARLGALPASPLDQFLGAALRALLDPDAARPEQEEVFRLAHALPPEPPAWCGTLALRVLERWSSPALERAWLGDAQAVAPLLDWSRPELFPDPRLPGLLRAHALLVTQGRDATDRFVGQVDGSPWWRPSDVRADLFAQWRLLIGAEVALQRPQGDMALTYSATLLAKPQDPARLDDPLARAFHVHLRNLRTVLHTLGQSRDATYPEVPETPDLGPAAPYLPPWRSAEHTRRAIEALRTKRWRPWRREASLPDAPTLPCPLPER